jgi:tungstate transport system ATP-binding protein
MTEILELLQVSHGYNGRFVLRIPHLVVHQGEIVGMAGPNGSGKTTLLKLMSFLEKSQAGEIRFRGQPAEPFSSTVRFRVSLLTQEPYLLKRSVFDNIAYGLKLRGDKNGPALDRKVAAALDLVGLPPSFAGRAWFALSGGEAQRVALAARLALQPDCLLLDEPTAGVDMPSAEKIRQAIVVAQQEWGTTLVISSHNLDWLHGLCDRLLFLYNGALLPGGLHNVLFGPWEDLPGGRTGKRLADGQLIVLLAPPPGGAAGGFFIRPEAITIAAASLGGDGAENRLAGVISGVFLANLPGQVRMQVRCADHLFDVALGQDLLRQEGWLPGQQVTLRFPVSAVTALAAG